MEMEVLYDEVPLQGKTLEEQEQIELILQEASAWGLRWEVEIFAKKLLFEGETDDPVIATIWAFEDWIK
jgi:hypothetical protein